MEQGGGWSELPMDLLELIVRRLYRLPNDYVRFGAVCESWRSVAVQNRCHIPPNQLPGLMVPGIDENSPTRRYLRLNHKSGLFEEGEDHANSNKQQQQQQQQVLLKVPHRHVCRGSAYGWLFSVNDELDTKLLNPFSGAEISLPSVATLPQPVSGGFNPLDKWYVDKAVFSSNPASFHDHDHDHDQNKSPHPPPVILIIYNGDLPRLAYCKLGDYVWTPLQYDDPNNYLCFLDAIYYKDQFFALDADGRIMAYDIGTTSNSSHTSIDHHCEVKVTQYPCVPGIQYGRQLFLVELQGELVVLTRKIKYDNEEEDDDDDDEEEEEEEEEEEATHSFFHSRTVGFTVSRFESSEHKWVEVTSLGDNALFVGYSTSYSLPGASNYPGCVPNSIYFTNGSGGGDACENQGDDIGVYDMKDNSIKPVLYSIGSQLKEPSPIWLTRNSVLIRCQNDKM